MRVNKRLQPYRLSYQDVVSDRFQADSYEPVPLELFKDTPFIIMKPGNDMYQRGFSMCRNAGFTPKVAIQMDQVLTSMILLPTVSEPYLSVPILSAAFRKTRSWYIIRLAILWPAARWCLPAKKGKYITAAMREFLRMAGAKRVNGVCPGKSPAKTGGPCKNSQKGAEEWN